MMMATGVGSGTGGPVVVHGQFLTVDDSVYDAFVGRSARSRGSGGREQAEYDTGIAGADSEREHTKKLS